MSKFKIVTVTIKVKQRFLFGLYSAPFYIYPSIDPLDKTLN